MFFSLSSYPCCFISFFSTLARRLWFSLGFSPLAPFGCGSPWSCSLQQHVLLTRTDLSFWSFGRFVAAAVRRWFPTPLQHHCVHPHNEGLHRGLLPRRGPSVRSAPLACPSCFSIVWFLSLVLSLSHATSLHCVLMTLSRHRHLLRNVFHTAVGCDCASCS